MAMDIKHTLRVSLRGKDNETYSGTIVISNLTLPGHESPNSASSNLSDGAQSRLEDPTGASYYVIAVVMVYGFSIVMLIASHIKRKHQKVQEDRQIHKYLQEFLVVQEKSSRDSYKRLKRSIIAKLYRDKSCTSRHLSKTLFPMMAIALPSHASDTDSRRYSMSRLSISRLSMASSIHRHPHVTSLQNVAEDATEQDSGELDQDICMEAIEPGMDPALKEFSDSDSESPNLSYKDKDYLEVPAITVTKGSINDVNRANNTQSPSPTSSNDARGEREWKETSRSEARDSSEDEVDVPVTMATTNNQGGVSHPPEENVTPRLPPPPPPSTAGLEEAAGEKRIGVERRRHPVINGHLQPTTHTPGRAPHVQMPSTASSHPPNRPNSDRPRLKMASIDHGTSKGVGAKVCSPVNGLMQEEDPELFNLRYGHGMGSCSPLIKDARDLWPAPGALRYGDPGAVTPPGLRYTNAGATITPPTPQYGSSLSPPPLHISPPRGASNSKKSKSDRQPRRQSPLSSPDITPRSSPKPSPSSSPSRNTRPVSRHSPRISPRHSPRISPRQSPRSERRLEEGLISSDRLEKSDISSPESEQLLHITCV